MKQAHLYFSKFVFGGFDNELRHDRLFFPYPSIRLGFRKYEKGRKIILALGILFWEIVVSVDIDYGRNEN